MIRISKTASASVMMATFWRMEVARSVETHVRPVSTAINAKHAQQASTLGKPYASSVTIQRPSSVMYVLNVAQDAKSAQTLTLARRVKRTLL